MALTEIPVELSSTPGIADSSNATAITIDSSEQVGIGVSPAARLHAYSNSAETLRLEGNDEYTYLSFKGTVSSSATSLGLIGYANQSGTAADLNIENTQNGAMTFATNDTIRMTIDNAGHVTMPNQPAFLVRPTSEESNIANSTAVSFGTEVFDVGSNFASNQFTAPVDGKYQLNMNIRFNNMDQDATYAIMRLTTSNRTFDAIIEPNSLANDPAYWVLSTSVVTDMDASDTAKVVFYFSGGTAQADVGSDSSFSGYLVA